MIQFGFKRARTALVGAALISGFAPLLAAAAITTGPLSITGTPPTTAVVGQPYDFKPSATVPAIGPNVTFWITDKPSWATFNKATGELSGTPPATGVAGDILISVVYNYTQAAYLPWFSIKIGSSGTSSSSSGSTNTAPKISGSPVTSVTAGTSYSFTPTASDANGDRLTFSVSNKPSWATFSTSTGTLSGAPSSANVGTYANVVISVSDGKVSSSLPAFSVVVSQYSSGTAQVNWLPPTSNSDGSVISNLSGYRIHYGTTASNLTQSVQVANPGASSYVVSNLASGTWYFAVGAYNSAGTESSLSNVVSKPVP